MYKVLFRCLVFVQVGCMYQCEGSAVYALDKLFMLILLFVPPSLMCAPCERQCSVVLHKLFMPSSVMCVPVCTCVLHTV